MSVSVIIVAAGMGTRFGRGYTPKAFFPLNGRPLLAHCILAFEEVDEVSEIIVTVRQEMMGKEWSNHLGSYSFKKIKEITLGGVTREDSVWAGLQMISKGTDIVLVHDGARPLIQPGLIEKVIREAQISGAAVPCLKIKPTIKEVDCEGVIVKTLPREHLWEAQTPQGFKTAILRQAFENFGQDRSLATDDAFLVEYMGGKIKVVEGDPKNIKITTPEDLQWAEMFLHGMDLGDRG